MINGTFTTEDRKKVKGKDIPFFIVCDRCGCESTMDILLYHKTGPYIDPHKIGVEFECTSCGNKFAGYIYGEPEKGVYNGDEI